MTHDLKVNEMFYTPESMDELTEWLKNTREPMAMMAAMLMWNLIAAGNHISKEDKHAD